MTNSIPASEFVNVIPGILGAGGNPLSLNAVFVDNSGDTSIPVGTVYPFYSLLAVQNWYGANSEQAQLAAIYFGGFTGAETVAGTLYFTQYATANVAAYVRGGSLGGLTLAQLQALSGTLIITVNGTLETSSSINLSAATSFSNAATIISAAFTGGSAPVCTYDSLRNAFKLTSPTTGAASTVSAVTGTLAAGLNFTAALGAVESQGIIADTPAVAMARVIAATQNWATFMTIVEPTITVKLQFATWVNNPGTNLTERFAYVCFDSDATALSPNATASFGYIVAQDQYNGCIPVWNPDGTKAAFICGAIAAINFSETNGRITLAYKGQSGLTPDVTSLTTYQNLLANGYNSYVSIATATTQFQNLQPGLIAGAWDWIDPYVNQIYLNASFQLDLMELLANTKSVPYNAQGYGLIRAACLDTIKAALNFGSIQPGVTLSAAQAQEVNTAAGTPIDGVLSTVGWYLQILPAAANVRAARGTPPMTFWYTDGGSVQSITLNSIDVQ